MSQTQKRSECKTMCWIVAAIAGLVLMILLYKVVGFGGFWSFIFGLIGGALAAYFLPQFVCGDEAENSGSGLSGTGTASAGVSSSGSGDVKAASVSSAGTATASSDATTPTPLMSGGAVSDAQANAIPQGETSAPAVTPTSTKAAKVKPVSADPRSEAISSGTTAAPATAPVAQSASAAKKAPAKTASKTTGAKAPAKATAKAPAKAAASPKRAPVAADGQPQVFDAAPADGADDLKLISGVGPKLEQTLNEMGIYQFQQVAAWRKKEIAWVDSRLKFKGRIERDDWMSQAKILAKGGETEFSKRKTK